MFSRKQEAAFQKAFRVERNRDINYQRDRKVLSSIDRKWSDDLRDSYKRHQAEVDKRGNRVRWIMLRIGDCYLCLCKPQRSHVVFHSLYETCVQQHKSEGECALEWCPQVAACVNSAHWSGVRKWLYVLCMFVFTVSSRSCLPSNMLRPVHSPSLSQCQSLSLNLWGPAHGTTAP